MGAGAAPKFHAPRISTRYDAGNHPGFSDPATPLLPANLAAPPPPETWSMPGSQVTTTGGNPPPGRTARPWGSATFEKDRLMPANPRRSTSRFRSRVDPRGAFAAIVSVLLVAACFLPFYSISGPGSIATPTVTVLNHAYGQWRVVLLIVALATIVVGITDSVLRVGMRGAVTVFVVLRVLVIAQLALWVYAFVARTPANAPPNFVYAVTWEAYAAVAAAFVALAATLAVIGKRSSDV